MSARSETWELKHTLNTRGIDASFEQANILRRAQLTLRGWAEAECGNSGLSSSWATERDEDTGKPFHCVYPHDSTKVRRTPIADREAGALDRVRGVCAALRAFYYHQTDPRGCSLHVSAERLTDQNYSTRGTPCIA